jgi:hypothetical protein
LRLHRSDPPNLAKQSPHAVEHRRHSSTLKNMYTQPVFTTWWIIYLPALKTPRSIRRSLTTMLTPKWSTQSDKSSTSCISNILRYHFSNLQKQLH